MAISLSCIEIFNCCICVGIIVNVISSSFLGFSKFCKHLRCLSEFWALCLYFILYLTGAIIALMGREGGSNDEPKLIVAQISLEMFNLFFMMILAVLLIYSAVLRKIYGNMNCFLRVALILFCVRFSVTVVFTMIRIIFLSLNNCSPSENWRVAMATFIINEINVLPFYKKIIEELWKRFFDDWKIREKRHLSQITFDV